MFSGYETKVACDHCGELETCVADNGCQEILPRNSWHLVLSHFNEMRHFCCWGCMADYAENKRYDY